ncbi:MAG: tetratricopeptide repeat protein, partial [Bacteroidota bacterium]
IELDNTYKEAYYNRAMVYNNLKKYELAIIDYTKAIELDNYDKKAYYHRGVVYDKLRRYKMALKDFLYVLNFDNTDEEAYNSIGIVYDNLKLYELAIKNYTRAIELNKNFVRAYRHRGIVYDRLEKYDLALKDLTKAIELDVYYFPSYQSRGIVYSNLKQHKLAIKDQTKVIDLNQYCLEAYNCRGSDYLALKKYELALKDFHQVIELDKKFSDVYANLGILYSEINNYQKMDFYMNLHLYYSFQVEQIKLSVEYLNLWQDHIYNYTFLLENFTIDFDSFLYVNYRNKIQFIQPIEDYYSFLSLSNSDKHSQESQRAILNYYLGSPIAAYIRYDEILDVDYYPLKAQELYYYALMADILKLDSVDILKAAIEDLSDIEDKSTKDLYYLGQLHLLNNDNSKALICFQNSQEFIPSLIQLISFEEDVATQKQLLEKLLKLDQDILIPYFTGYPKTAIKTKHSFETQFEHYFYTTELFTAVSKIKENYQLPEYLLGYNHLKIWEAFYLSDIEQTIIDKAFRNHKIQKLVDTIIQDLEVKLVSIEENDRTNYLEKIKHSLREDQDLAIREAFDSLLNTLKDDGNIENHLGQMIEDFRLEKAQLYLYFISYFYLQGNLNSYQAFVLFSYLIDIVSTKRSKAIRETIKVLIPSEFSELFLTTLGLSKYLHNLVHLSKAYHVLYEDYNEYQLQKESKYMTFKRNLNSYISMNKETLSEEMFAKKFQCFPAIIDHNLQSI